MLAKVDDSGTIIKTFKQSIKVTLQQKMLHGSTSIHVNRKSMESQRFEEALAA